MRKKKYENNVPALDRACDEVWEIVRAQSGEIGLREIVDDVAQRVGVNSGDLWKRVKMSITQRGIACRRGEEK